MSCPLMKKPQRDRGGSWFLSPSYYSLPGFLPYSLGSFAVPLTRTYPFIQAQAVSAISLLPASPLAALSAAAAPTQGGGSGSIFMAPGWAWQPPSSKDKVLRVKAGRSHGVGWSLRSVSCWGGEVSCFFPLMLFAVPVWQCTALSRDRARGV